MTNGCVVCFCVVPSKMERNEYSIIYLYFFFRLLYCYLFIGARIMQVGTMCATFSVNFQVYLLVACARCRQKDQTLNMAFATTTKRSAECRDNDDDDDNGSGERGESLIKFLIIQMCTNESVFIHAYSLRQSTLLLLLLFLVSIVGVDVYNALSFIGIYTKHIIADTLPVPELETPRTIGAK